MLSLWFLVALYATIPFVEFLAPYELRSRHPDHVYAPPQRVHLFHEGGFVGPFVYGQLLTINMENLRREYREDRTRRYRLQFFAPGEPYRMWGLWRADRHLIGVEEGGTLFLLGHRSPGAGHALADHPRGAHLAHRRAAGHLGQLRAGARVRRAVGLLRRDHRHRDPAVHRGDPRVSRAAAVDGAVGRPAAPLGSDPRLRRHHGDPRGPRVDGARPQRAREAPRGPRGGLRHRRGAHGRLARPTSSGGTSCRRSRAT